LLTALRRLAMVIVLLAAPLQAAAQDLIPLNAYGDLPAIEDMAISPDGKMVAVLGKVQGARGLLVIDEDNAMLKFAAVGDSKVRYIRWAGNETVTVVASVTAPLGIGFTADSAEFYRTILVPVDNGEIKVVFGDTQRIVDAVWGQYGYRKVDGKWLGFFGGIELSRSTRSRVEYVIVHGRPSLFQVDLNRNNAKRIDGAAPEGYFRRWMLDERGEVAAILDIELSRGSWKIVNTSSSTIASGRDATGDVWLVALGETGETLIYVVENDLEQKTQYFELPLSGGEAVEVFADVDVERFYTNPENGRMLGYYDGNSDRPVLFDPARQAVLQKVYAAFPDLQVQIVDWTPDFGKFIVRTSGNQDSGTWYQIDIAARTASALGYDRDPILPEHVGAISTFEYSASDGLEMDGILTLPPGREAKNLPIVMLPHGGPYARDRATFDWWAQAFASRGYAVFQPNFRGSTNRGTSFRMAGYGQWGRKMQTDISDGLAALTEQGIVDPSRACIMGASYGGYAALAGVTLQQDLYRCAVAVAPVSDLTDHYNTENRESGRTRLMRNSLRESMGDPSGYDEVSPRRHAANADAPVLLIHGKDDTVVAFSQSTRMERALSNAGKPVTMIALEGEDHWLSRAETRKQMLGAAMAFVLEHNPPN